MKTRINFLFLVLCTIFFSCNAPPLYETRAEKFLRSKNVEEDLIKRVKGRQVISTKEAERLATFSNIPVLHLLANNPSTPENILRDLANHSNFEVHTGLVSNPATPIEVVLNFRTQGRYTTVNAYMARNPNLPTGTLVEMYNQGEIGKVSPALNPNCPPEIMWRIFREGDSLSRIWLATNPNLPEELMDRLETSPDSTVKQYLSTNRAYIKYQEQKQMRKVEQGASADAKKQHR